MYKDLCLGHLWIVKDSEKKYVEVLFKQEGIVC